MSIESEPGQLSEQREERCGSCGIKLSIGRHLPHCAIRKGLETDAEIFANEFYREHEYMAEPLAAQNEAERTMLHESWLDRPREEAEEECRTLIQTNNETFNPFRARVYQNLSARISAERAETLFKYLLRPTNPKFESLHRLLRDCLVGIKIEGRLEANPNLYEPYSDRLGYEVGTTSQLCMTHGSHPHELFSQRPSIRIWQTQLDGNLLAKYYREKLIQLANEFKISKEELGFSMSKTPPEMARKLSRAIIKATKDGLNLQAPDLAGA